MFPLHIYTNLNMTIKFLLFHLSFGFSSLSWDHVSKKRDFIRNFLNEWNHSLSKQQGSCRKDLHPVKNCYWAALCSEKQQEKTEASAKNIWVFWVWRGERGRSAWDIQTISCKNKVMPFTYISPSLFVLLKDYILSGADSYCEIYYLKYIDWENETFIWP